MNKLHKMTLIIVFFIGCFSAYSLAEINISQQMNYSWYDGKEFCEDTRFYDGKWNDKQYPKDIYFDVLTRDRFIKIEGKNSIRNIIVPKINSQNEFLIFASLGEVDKKGYNIKVKEISQHGNVIEVMLNLASLQNNNLPYEINFPYEFIKMNKNDLDIKGNLLFIFKDSSGLELYKEKCFIK